MANDSATHLATARDLMARRGTPVYDSVTLDSLMEPLHTDSLSPDSHGVRELYSMPPEHARLALAAVSVDMLARGAHPLLGPEAAQAEEQRRVDRGLLDHFGHTPDATAMLARRVDAEVGFDASPDRVLFEGLRMRLMFDSPLDRSAHMMPTAHPAFYLQRRSDALAEAVSQAPTAARAALVDTATAGMTDAMLELTPRTPALDTLVRTAGRMARASAQHTQETPAGVFAAWYAEHGAKDHGDPFFNKMVQGPQAAVLLAAHMVEQREAQDRTVAAQATEVDPAIAYTKAVTALRRAGHPYMGNGAALEDAMTPFYTEGHTADNALAKVFAGMDVPTARAALAVADRRVHQHIRQEGWMQEDTRAMATLDQGMAVTTALEGTADGLAVGAFLHWTESRDAKTTVPFYRAESVEDVLVHGLRAHLVSQDPAFRSAMASAFAPALREPWPVPDAERAFQQRREEISIVLDTQSHASTQSFAQAATHLLYANAERGHLGRLAAPPDRTTYQEIAYKALRTTKGYEALELAKDWQDAHPAASGKNGTLVQDASPHPMALVQAMAAGRALEMGDAQKGKERAFSQDQR